MKRPPDRKQAYKLDWWPVKVWHARYASGEIRVEDIAKEFGCGADLVRAWFRRHGLSTRVHARYVCPTPEEVRAFHVRYMAGEKVGSLAGEIPCAAGSLLNMFRRQGLPTFRVGGNPNSRRDGAGLLRFNAARKKNPERYSGESSRVGDWAPKTEPHDCITVDGTCLLCGQQNARMA